MTHEFIGLDDMRLIEVHTSMIQIHLSKRGWKGGGCGVVAGIFNILKDFIGNSAFIMYYGGEVGCVVVRYRELPAG